MHDDCAMQARQVTAKPLLLMIETVFAIEVVIGISLILILTHPQIADLLGVSVAGRCVYLARLDMAEGWAGNRAAGNKRFRASEYGLDENYRHQSKKLFQSNDDNPGIHQRQDVPRSCFSTDHCTSAPDCPEIYRANQERWPQAQWLPDEAGVVAISRESTGAANGEVEYQCDDLYLPSQNLWLFGDSEEGLEILEPNLIAVPSLQYDTTDLEIPSPPTSLTSVGDDPSVAANSSIPSAAVTAETLQQQATSAETGVNICYGTVRTFSV